jgi:hypothetical protein
MRRWIYRYDVLEIEEMWMLRICAWNNDVVNEDEERDGSSSEEDEMFELDESGNDSRGGVGSVMKGETKLTLGHWLRKRKSYGLIWRTKMMTGQ